MKAIVNGRICVVIESMGDCVIVETTDGDTFRVPFNEPSLIIDPTDGDLEAVIDGQLGLEDAGLRAAPRRASRHCHAAGKALSENPEPYIP